MICLNSSQNSAYLEGNTNYNTIGKENAYIIFEIKECDNKTLSYNQIKNGERCAPAEESKIWREDKNILPIALDKQPDLMNSGEKVYVEYEKWF